MPICLRAAPMTDVVDFDVNGDGTLSPALRLRQVGNRLGGFLRLEQELAVDEGSTYCASFQFAIDNRANERTGRYRFFVDIGGHHSEALTETPIAGTVTRSLVRFVFVADSEPDAGLRIDVHHDSGPEDDPTLYLDAVEVLPLNASWLEDRYEQQVRIDAGTVLGWEHDLARLGLEPSEFVGVAQVELVVWDDEPGPPSDGLERIELSVNGVVLPGPDIGGTEAVPMRLLMSFPWIECRNGFDGQLQMRLRTVPVGGSAAGDMFFGAATARLQAGQFGATLVDNGDFDDGAHGWTCDGAPCGATAVEATTWSRVKQRYRVR